METVPFHPEDYENIEERNRNEVIEEIKRKDAKFYDQWLRDDS